MKIGFLGAGLMGTSMVRRFLHQGHQVRVWNRTPAKAEALRSEGAVPCPNAAGAVEGVDRIHLILSDDQAVDETLEPLAGKVPPDCWILDHSTTLPEPTGRRSDRWAGRGGVYLHAPVMMSPGNALAGEGFILVSGKHQWVSRVLPDLGRMTGKVIYLGEAPQLAAVHKLIGNLAFLGQYGLVADIFRLAASAGISPKDALVTFQDCNPGASLPALGARVASGEFSPPDFTVAMARKDVRLMQEAAGSAGITLAVTSQVAALQDAALARGEADWDTAAAFRFPTA